MDQDKDLDSLRGLEAFDLLMEELRQSPVEKKRECRYKAKFQHHMQRPQEENKSTEKPAEESQTSDVPSVALIEEKIEAQPETIPVHCAATGEVVAQVTPELKNDPEPKLCKRELKIKIFEAQLQALNSMGFSNEHLNLKALRRTNGDLSQAVAFLLR